MSLSLSLSLSHTHTHPQAITAVTCFYNIHFTMILRYYGDIEFLS
jgi:hypothetical protein